MPDSRHSCNANGGVRHADCVGRFSSNAGSRAGGAAAVVTVNARTSRRGWPNGPTLVAPLGQPPRGNHFWRVPMRTQFLTLTLAAGALMTASAAQAADVFHRPHDKQQTHAKRQTQRTAYGYAPYGAQFSPCGTSVCQPVRPISYYGPVARPVGYGAPCRPCNVVQPCVTPCRTNYAPPIVAPCNTCPQCQVPCRGACPTCSPFGHHGAHYGPAGGFAQPSGFAAPGFASPTLYQPPQNRTYPVNYAPAPYGGVYPQPISPYWSGEEKKQEPGRVTDRKPRGDRNRIALRARR